MDACLRKRIRETYKDLIPTIMESRHQTDPYIFDFDMPMTPIEENVWHDIRVLGLPFYMQFPVGPYFIDFADPIKKIGVEVDGKEWHQDHDADDKREKELNRLGWVIVRIPGYKTFKRRSDFFQNDEDEYIDLEARDACMNMFLAESSEGILLSLKRKWYDHEQKEESKLTKLSDVMQSVINDILDKSSRISSMCDVIEVNGVDRRVGR